MYRLFYKNNKTNLSLAILAMIILSMYNLVVSWLLQVIIDIVSGNSDMQLKTVVLITTLSFLVFLASYALYRIARPRYLQRAMTQYKEAIFSKMTEKNINTFSTESTSEYISALTNDMKTIEDNYLDCVFTIVDYGVGFVGAVLLMLWYSPTLTIITILLSFFPLIASLPFTKKLSDAEYSVSEKNSFFVAMVKDILTGFSVVKGFRAENEITQLFSKENRQLEAAKYVRRATEETINVLATAASVVMRLGIFILGACLATTNSKITPGIVLVFLQLVTFVISPIERFPQIFANRIAAKKLMKKIEDALSQSIRDDGDKLVVQLNKRIMMCGLSFQYEENHPVLDKIDIAFDRGKKYAIVGPSGSGKTTLLNLLVGSYANYSGNILYDDVELRDIKAESIFEQVTLVQQNVFVFNDTIRNNVTMFKEFDDDVLERAYQMSGLHDVIKSRGSSYVCGENGAALSGGEKQRVAIAIALLRGASTILIDEATAALDNATSFEVINTILNMSELTCIVVTHRLEEKLLQQYDEIIVLNAGTIAEKGSFFELMERKELFYSLFTIAQESR